MSFEDSTVRAPERQPSLSALPDEKLSPAPGRPQRPDRLSIDAAAARTGASLAAVAPHLGALTPATLRVYLAVLRQLSAWRRDAEAVDVANLAAASGTSTASVYAALRALTDAGALTWTATGPRSGIVGLPRAGSAPAPGRTWDGWADTTTAAVALIDAVLVRQELDDDDAPEGWVVKRGAGGAREASAPVSVLRLATALLAATWPAQSPVAATSDIDTGQVGKPEAVRMAWRWLSAHAGVAYTPRPGRGLRGVGLPGYEDHLPGGGPSNSPSTGTSKPPYAETGSAINPPYAETGKPPYAETISFFPGRSTQAPPTPRTQTSPPTHQPDEGQGGEDLGENTHEPQAAAPPGGVVCRRPLDEAALELALIALAAVACPPPATRQATRALMRRCAEPAEVLAAAGWTSADVADWLAADLRANPVKQVRDASALAGHLLGKAAAAAAAGAKRPTAVRAAQAARAEAERAEALAHRKRVDDARRATAAVVAEALPHLAEMTAEERFALRPRADRRRWEVSDFADLDRLHAAVLEPLCWTWHTKRCEDELSAVGWEAAADFAQDRELSWFAEMIRENQALPKMFVAPLHAAWCAAHHTHDGEAR